MYFNDPASEYDFKFKIIY